MSFAASMDMLDAALRLVFFSGKAVVHFQDPNLETGMGPDGGDSMAMVSIILHELDRCITAP